MICFGKTQNYKDSINEKTNGIYSDVLTDAFVDKALKSKTVDHVLANGTDKSVEGVAEKVIVLSWMKDLFEDKGDGKKRSMPRDKMDKWVKTITNLRVGFPGNALTMLMSNVAKDVVVQDVIQNYGQAVQPESVPAQTIEQHKNLVSDIGGGEEAKSEVKDAVKVAKQGVSFEEALKGQESIFTSEEQAQIKKALNGKNLKVMSVSRKTDPAFFSKEIVKFLEENSKKPFTDPTRVNAIEIWSKHDGMPIQDILDACKKYKVAPMMSFSITGLGGTSLEGGVMKYNDLLDRIEKLAKSGSLNPLTTTIRIDPILVGVTNMDDIRKIVERAKNIGVKKFVTSLVQSYGYLDETPGDRKVTSGISNALAKDGKSYDWEKYYGRYTQEEYDEYVKLNNQYQKEHNVDYNTARTELKKLGHEPVYKNVIGKIKFKPKQQYIDQIGNVLLELDKDPNITIQTCAFGIEGLKNSACLDPLIIERLTGVDVTSKDGKYDRDTSRPECMCYGAHGDFFAGQQKKCYSSCAYCYAAHSGDNALNYYDENGNLKVNDYTNVRTNDSQSQQQTSNTNSSVNYYDGLIKPEENTVFVFGSNPEGRHGAGSAKIAKEQFGAIYGQGEGLQGNAYALPTKDLRVKENNSLRSIPKDKIVESIKKLYDTARQNPAKNFKVAYTNGLNKATLNGYTGAEMIEMFKSAGEIPSNVIFSKNWESGFASNATQQQVQPQSPIKPQKPQKPAKTVQQVKQTADDDAVDDEDNQPIIKVPLPKTFNSTLTSTGEVFIVTQVDGDTIVGYTKKNLVAGERYDRLGKEQIVNIPDDLEIKKNAKLVEMWKSTSRMANQDRDLKRKHNSDDTNILTSKKAENMKVFSNYEASDGLFLNTSEFNEDSIDNSDAVILFSNSQAEIDTYIGMINSKNSERELNEQIVLAINPSESVIKNIVDGSDAITMLAGRGAAGKKLDNLYQNTRMTSTNAEIHNSDFIENADMQLFARKIQHLYNKNKKKDVKQKAVMGQVLADIKREIKSSSDEYVKNQLQRIVDNWKHITSLISVNTAIDNDVDEYDFESDDVLWSESHNTSNMPRDGILNSLLQSFNTGKVDELGTPIYYEPMVINNILTNAISGSKDSDEMMERLKAGQRKNKFMATILANIENDQSGRLRSILYTKYANLYRTQYVTINGDRIINEATDFATTSINIGIVSNPNEEIFVFGENANESKINASVFAIEKLFANEGNINSVDPYQIDMIRQMQPGITDQEILDKLGIRDFYDQRNLDSLKYYLANAGMELDNDDHDMRALDRNEILAIRDTLAKIYRERARIKQADFDKNKFKSYNKNYYEQIIKLLNSISQQKTESLVRTAGESKFVFADKNYINTILDGLHKDRDNFVDEQFLKYGYFTSSEKNDRESRMYGIYSSLIRKLATSDRKPGKEYNDWFTIESFFVNKTEDGASKYNDLTPDELRAINRKMFFREEKTNKDRVDKGEDELCFVHAPIYADKGSLHYYRVPKIGITASLNNDMSLSKEPEIVTEIKNLIALEVSRINEVKERARLIAEGKLEPIANYDTTVDDKGNVKKGNGENFMFLPLMNHEKLYDGLVNAKEEDRETILSTAVANVIGSILSSDMMGVQVSKQDIKDLADSIKEGDWVAYNGILNSFKKTEFTEVVKDESSEFGDELGDIDMDMFDMDQFDIDIPGMENSKEEKPFKPTVFNEMERVLTTFIREADILQLTITDPALYSSKNNQVDVQKRYAQVQAGYQRPDTKSKYGREYMRSITLVDDKISLSDEELAKIRQFLTEASKRDGVNIDVESIMKAFKDINVADAQSYRTLSSYRAVRDMYGQWSEADEALYQKLINGNGEKLTMDDYNVVWQTIKPFVYTQQATAWKDKNGNTRYTKVGYQYKNSENVLFNMFALLARYSSGAGTRLAEINRFMEDYQIDTVQFESAVKVGQQGNLNLNNIDTKDVYSYLEQQTGVLSNQEFPETSGLAGDPEVIHEIPYTEWGIKTSTPPHMYDAKQQLGSQLKKLVPGDIPEGARIFFDFDMSALGVDTSKDVARIKLREGDVIEVKREEDGKYSMDEKDFKRFYNAIMSNMIMDNYKEVKDIFGSKEALSDELQALMKDSPKYDYDIKQALRIGKNGDFIVDPRNPIIKDKIVLLLSSLLKNRINKQLTRGGTAIQMACWGGNDLHIERNPDGSIKYMECYMPAYSRSFIEAYMNKDGVIDVNKCKDDNLLKALCYRVPTEDIYSMIPLKIKGFTPMQFGTNIMLPKEITSLTGSDFDVDKMYLFLPEFKLKDKYTVKKEKSEKEFEESSVYGLAKFEIYNKVSEENKRRTREGEAELTQDEIDEITKRIRKDYYRAFCVEKGYLIQEPEYIKYDSGKSVSENSYEQKANMLLTLMRGCITSPHNITKEQNPGGFDYLKDMAKKYNPDVDIPMNLTEKQYLNFFNLNMTGKKLIGIYANHNVAHAQCQGKGLSLAESIYVDGEEYSDLSGIFSRDNRRISRNIAEFLAASVDNAKDPVLAKLWQNKNTASTTCFLLRLGVPVETIVKMYKDMADTEDFKTFLEKGTASFRGRAEKYDSRKGLETFTETKYGKQYNFFAFLGKYADTISNIETLNGLLKCDSTNGAMYDLVDIADKMIKINKMRADKNIRNLHNVLPNYEEDSDLLTRTNDEIMQKLGEDPTSYQVAYYLTYVNFKNYYKDVMDPQMVDEIVSLGSQLQRFSQDDIKNFITEYTKYQLRYIKYFQPRLNVKKSGEVTLTSTEDIIKKTLEEMPKKLETLKKRYPDNMFIKMLTRFETEKGDFLMIRNISDMRAETINEVKSSFNKLYSSFTGSKDAQDLIMYSLCINGFGYSPLSFISMIPIKSLSKVSGMENLYRFFEIDNIDKFEDDFIIKNDLAERVSETRLAKYHTSKEFKFPSKSKLLVLKDKENGAVVYYKKLYETSDGMSWYTDYENTSRKFANDKIYDILNDDIIPAEITENREQVIESVAENVIKEYNRLGENIDDATKDSIISLFSGRDNSNLARYYNMDENVLDNYSPMNIDWCK